MFIEVRVGVRSPADREDEVAAAGLGVGERPVFWVARVPDALEGQSQDPGVVRHRRVHHVLFGVCRRLSPSMLSPTDSKTRKNSHLTPTGAI